MSGHIYKINYLTYWTAFWSLLIGLGAALLGGVVGGAVPRRVDEPYLDLQRATARETTTPVVDRRAPMFEEPVPTGVHTAPVGTQTPSSVGRRRQMLRRRLHTNFLDRSSIGATK